MKFLVKPGSAAYMVTRLHPPWQAMGGMNFTQAYRIATQVQKFKAVTRASTSRTMVHTPLLSVNR